VGWTINSAMPFCKCIERKGALNSNKSQENCIPSWNDVEHQALNLKRLYLVLLTLVCSNKHMNHLNSDLNWFLCQKGFVPKNPPCKNNIRTNG
jgi:hypothetical protein